MNMLQLRYDAGTADLVARVLENATPEALSAEEYAKVKELAAHLRYRATRFWGPDYTNNSASQADLFDQGGQVPPELKTTASAR